MNTTTTNRKHVGEGSNIFGKKVRAYGVADPAYDGHICTVTANATGWHTAHGEFTSIAKPDDTIRLSFTSYEEVDEPTVEVTMIPVADHDRAVADLNARIESLTRDRDTLRTRSAAYAEDFDTVGTMLMEEAEHRGWCSEYDEFVEAVNSKLGLLSLPEREQEYEVEVTVTGTLTTTTTVTVTARSQEDADTIVGENMDEYVDGDDVLADAARHTSFDSIECEVE